MAARIGRKVAFTWNAAAVTGVREVGISINGEPIDVTSEEDDGVRLLLSEAAELAWEISLSGISKETALFDDAATITARTQAVTMTYPDGSTISGNFYLSSYSETDPYKDASTFEATLQSSGAITYTPA